MDSKFLEMKDLRLYIKTLILSFASVLALSSCDDFFDTVITLDPPAFDPAMAVIGEAHNGDSILNIRVTEARGILSTDLVKTVDDAQVSARLNQESLLVTFEGFSTDSLDNGYRIHFGRPLQQNDEIYIEISHSKFNTAIFTDKIPTTPNIQIGKAKLNGGIDQSGDKVSSLEFTIDGGDETMPIYFGTKISYAQFVFHCRRQEFVNGAYICLEGDTISIKNESGYSFNDPTATDSRFGSIIKKTTPGPKSYVGLIYNQYIQPFRNSESDYKVPITFINYSQQAYNYETSYHQYFLAADNPFATPVNVFSNIQNGHGFIKLTNEVIIEAEIE